MKSQTQTTEPLVQGESKWGAGAGNWENCGETAGEGQKKEGRGEVVEKGLRSIDQFNWPPKAG